MEVLLTVQELMSRDVVAMVRPSDIDDSVTHLILVERPDRTEVGPVAYRRPTKKGVTTFRLYLAP
ncbi:hypothetical protein SCLCIDRAFT_1217495 [Scleroderma citrinum Foug A]|uniref:Uncharacterized protein n=1 Tax=Scleroderma citrinum Foug A TaxID=1036808 RepID=A0A0C3A4U1_9AGAM|nr:hypothetical protein SCLCIDRAFT_1217495 [Scleroderma citrinum Foug A]